MIDGNSLMTNAEVWLTNVTLTIKVTWTCWQKM